MLSASYVDRRWYQLALIVAAIVVLYVAAAVGMAYVAGFGEVGHRLEHAEWWWLAAAAAGVLISFVGYVFAYRGLKSVEGGPGMSWPALLAVVIAGFGGFFAHGGTVLDEYAMRAGGASAREGKARTIALAGLEHGALAIIVCPAAAVALILGDVIPRTDFTWPWALIPPGGFVLAMWLAERYRARLRRRGGIAGKVGVFLDSVHLIYAMFVSPRRYGTAVLGMMVYWGADMFALWAATAAFGYRMSALAVIVVVGTGMIFTRRTAPLAGAGLMLVALTATLWYGAAVPFAAATLGVAAYRLIVVFGPMPFAFAALPRLRELGRTGRETTGRGTRPDTREPATEH
jgi:uncharacterized membrane protein YbhN (UPF0104 family)